MKQITSSTKTRENTGRGKLKEDSFRFEILQTAEFREKKKEFPYYREMIRNLSSIHYCKAEALKECIIGTIRLPRKNEEKTAAMTFGFYLAEQTMIFVEEGDKLKTWVQKHSEMLYDSHTPEELCLSVMELMTEDDLVYLLQIETTADKMEKDITNGISKNFFPILTRYRQKLSELNSYYEQLVDIGEFFQSAACASMVQNEQEWGKFTRRAERLQNHVHLLRENMLQLRELYQSVQDARQNRIIGILTVVTTFFLPLNLLTGWYGMNFINMPELHWKYGYLTVILAAFMIAVSEFVYLQKRKNFFKNKRVLPQAETKDLE